MFLEFDLFHIARQAIISKNFFAAVVFCQHLVKMVKKTYVFEDTYSNCYGARHLRYGNATLLLREAIKAHDKTLMYKGPYGSSHRCNVMPFHVKDSQNNMAHKANNTRNILDRNALYHYNSIERKRRKTLGRKKWSENHKLLENDGKKYQTALQLQVEKLCNGKKLRVSGDCQYVNLQSYTTNNLNIIKSNILDNNLKIY